jgi:beta-phosphoglucomutase-like phosphatase (HAD superfamily)
MMLKAVIFDIDGTLIDSVDLHARSWVESFARFGAEVRLDDVRGHIGEGADRLVPSFVPGISESKRKQIEEYRSALFKRSRTYPGDQLVQAVNDLLGDNRAP